MIGVDDDFLEPCPWRLTPGKATENPLLSPRRQFLLNPAPMTKKLFIKTYGCQMNVYDCERMADALAPHGYEPTHDIGDADLVVLNTCHIREKASEKVFSELGRLRELREERRALGEDFVIGVAGCVAQAEGEEIVRRDAGGRSRVRAAELSPAARAAGARRARRPVVETDFPAEDKFEHLPARGARGHDQARAHRLPHRAGRLRQVLLLLRRALHARRRSLAAGRAGAGRGARTSSTPA